ncbi:MAG: aminotransferase class V-fold PLP-dependent enzyme [Candidatus Malihini olakiniferum]
MAFYSHEYAAVHRDIHTLSAKATSAMEAVCKQVARYINAASAEEVVFVRGTTEAISLVANNYVNAFIEAGDNILITEMSTMLISFLGKCWRERQGIELRVLPLTAQGKLDLSQLDSLLDKRMCLLAMTQVSNVLGTVNPLETLIREREVRQCSSGGWRSGCYASICRRACAGLDCDFYTFSKHRFTARRVLYAKHALLNATPPWEGGGAMIRDVSLTKGIRYADVPLVF